MSYRMRGGALWVVVLAMLLAVAAVAAPPQEKPCDQATATMASDRWDPTAAVPADGGQAAAVPAKAVPAPARSLAELQACSKPGQKGGGDDGLAPMRLAPPAPEAVSATVLWDQPSNGSNGIVDQYFPDFGAGVYSADDFIVDTPWNIGTIFVDGQGVSLSNAVSLNWAIYADQPMDTKPMGPISTMDLPDGYPGYGAAPIWSMSLAPTAPGVTLGDSNTQVTLDIIAAGGSAVPLAPGTYWLEFYPSLSFGSYGQWFWDTASTTNGSIGQVVDPADLFGSGWTFWVPWTLIDETVHDAAFRLETPSCDSTVTINMTALGGTTSDWPVTHGSQTARLFRDGVPSTCAVPKASCPGVFSSGPRAFDSFSFTNTGADPVCITTTLATPCTSTNFLFMVAYLGLFDPANICTNYLADIGSSPNPSITMSFTVPAGADFTLVVAEVTQDAGCPSGYTLTVDGLPCTPVCPTIFVFPPSLPTPTVGVPYSVMFGAFGGTEPYTFAVTAGTLPPGLVLAADGTLSGTLTALGDFSFTVTATDSLDCTGEQSYSMATFSAYFLDDQGRSKLCVNRLTGDYTWEITTGPGMGTYTGVANILNGGTKIYSKPGAPDYLNCTYDAIRKRAAGYYLTAAGDYSALKDYNTTNNPGGCFGVQQPN